ncbi:MAG: gliding motility-associated C-terminal domain-containing protein, partial [Chitinophagaceae bacterium]
SIGGTMQHLKKMPDGKILMTAGRNIAATADNGTTWTVAPRPPVPYGWWSLFAMDVTPGGRIVTGGTSGVLYDSLPGSPWRTQYRSVKPLDAFGTPNDFSSMDWADCNNGVVVGSNGTIAKTTDGGKTWIDNSSPIFAAAQIGFSKVLYPAVNRMYFSSFNSLYKSPDQGNNIDVIFTEPNANGQLKSFAAIGTDKIWMAGYRSGPTTAQRRALIFRTTNAGALAPVWDTVGVFPTGTFVPQFNTIKFANQDTGYVCGSRGKVYRTINGGTTWTDVSPDTTVNSNATNNYSGMSLVNGQTIFIGGSSKKLFRSVDAGATWTDLTLSLTTPSTISNFSSLSIIEMNDINNGYILAGNYLLTTSNGWTTWKFDMPPIGISSMMLYPKVSGPITGKKLFFTTLQASTFVNSQISATILEYGKDALIKISSSETTTPTCDNAAQGTVVINASGGIPPYTYSVNGSPFQSSNIFNGVAQGTKTVVINDAGCGSITKTVTVGLKPNPIVSAGTDKTILEGDPTRLAGSVVLGNPVSIAWTPAATLTFPNTLDPFAKPTGTTIYTMTVTDANGCVAADNMQVTVLPYCLKIMDAFTPNGDGQNDRWIVTNNGGNCVERVYATVFNRYGNVVFKDDNYQNDWDGTYNGKPVADGTYYYVISYRLINGGSAVLRGDVTILR